VFDKLVYGADNILASQAMGTQKSIEAITIDDLKNYYAKFFSSSVAKIMILGDITKEQGVKLFSGLSGWKTVDVKFPELMIASVSKPGIYFVDVPKARQSVVNAGHLGMRYADPDYYKAVVMNHKLGGDFSGILNMILRETKSFTYGARSTFSGSEYPGTFRASTQVQTNATFETVQIIRDEVAKFRNGISEDDLNQVKSTLIKSNSGRFETLQQLASMLQPVVSYGVPFDYISQREATVKSMTPQEAKDLAQKYLQPDKMIYLIVGDKATQFDKLKDLGLGNPVLLDRDGKVLPQN
jgi:zinc protease